MRDFRKRVDRELKETMIKQSSNNNQDVLLDYLFIANQFYNFLENI